MNFATSAATKHHRPAGYTAAARTRQVVLDIRHLSDVVNMAYIPHYYRRTGRCGACGVFARCIRKQES